MQTNFQSNKQPVFGGSVNPIQPKKKLNKVGMLIIAAFVILLVGAIGTSVYFYKKANVNTTQDAVKELADITEKVGRHIVLPAGETPTMATVSDPEKLKDQSFFANAKKGDKVLIFSDSRKAILYDPVADKIIEVAPISATAGAPTAN